MEAPYFKRIKKWKTQPRNEEIKHEYTVFGIVLRFCGTLSAIICFIAGAEMTSIEAVSGRSVVETFYNAFGVFVIGLAFFIIPLLFGIAYLLEKN
jgi:uncharacterized membrane protein